MTRERGQAPATQTSRLCKNRNLTPESGGEKS
jgi:hypothetical protein